MDQHSPTLETRYFIESVAYLLLETFEGSPEGQGSAYLDKGAGFFTTIDSVNADQASTLLHGSSIASHTEHAKFYLDRICEFMTGRTERVNWDDSWLIETVNDTEWDALRESVKRSYANTLKCVAGIDDWTERRVGECIAMIAHTAYHLGAMRQIRKVVNNQ
jgi:hypothetical protein